jgi:xanthine dehydrogenase accessory factor
MKAAVINDLLEARRTRVPIALVSELESGAQRLVRFDEAEGDALADALRRGFRFDESRVVSDQGKEYFIAIHNPPLKLIVVGAVHIAQALIPIARGLNYDVVVIDPRGAFATAERFPGVSVRAAWPDEVLPQIGLDMRSAMVLLTHDPKIDDPALLAALRSQCFYIGALGSKRTHAQRLDRFKAKGFTEAQLARIHAPIGLEIGARGAAEIAVAIAAEMTKVLRLGSEVT